MTNRCNFSSRAAARGSGLRRLTYVLVALQALSLAWPPMVPAADGTPRERLRQAQEALLYMRTKEALSLATQVVAHGGVDDAQLREAHVIAAQCHLELGNDEELEESICRAHAVDPLWRPSAAIFTEREVARFANALQSCPESAPRVSFPEPEVADPTGSAPFGAIPGIAAVLTEPSAEEAPAKPRAWYRRPVGWIVGGAAAAAGLAVVVFGGGGDSSPEADEPTGMGDFPDPPAN